MGRRLVQRRRAGHPTVRQSHRLVQQGRVHRLR